jgi:hypothetical protein
VTVNNRTEEDVLRTIIAHLLNAGAKAADDARWLVRILPADLLGFFRAEVTAAVREKAGDPAKARKIFLALGKTARAIYGPEFASVKKTLDTQSRASVGKTDREQT